MTKITIEHVIYASHRMTWTWFSNVIIKKEARSLVPMFYSRNKRQLGRSNQLTFGLMDSCLPSLLTFFQTKTFVPKIHQRGYIHARNMKS
jgi:hypothetical protein